MSHLTASAAPADASDAPTSPTATNIARVRIIAKVGDVIRQISTSFAEMTAIEAAAKKEIEDAEKKATTAVREATDAEKEAVEKECSLQLATEVKAIKTKSKQAIAVLTKKGDTLALLSCCARLGTKLDKTVTMKTATEDQKLLLGGMKVMVMKIANPDADLLTIPELCEITLFFCGEEALAEFKAKLIQWAFDAEEISVKHGNDTFTVYLTPEHPNNTALPPSHKDCTNPKAIVVHKRVDIHGKATLVKVFQQDHDNHLIMMREKSRLELQKLHSTGAVKTDGDVTFTEADAEELQRLSKALADVALPMAIGTPVRLQWKMSHQADSRIPKNHRAYIQTLQSSALLTLAMEMMDSSNSEIREKGEALKLKVLLLKGDPKLYADLLKKCNEDKDAGVEISQITLQKLDIAKPKSVTGEMLLEHLTGVVSLTVSALMCEAMAVMADMLIADKLAAEEAAALAAAEKRAAKLAAAKLAAEQAAALVAATAATEQATVEE